MSFFKLTLKKNNCSLCLSHNISRRLLTMTPPNCVSEWWGFSRYSNQIALLGETFKSMYHLMRTPVAKHTGMTFFVDNSVFPLLFVFLSASGHFLSFFWKLKLCMCVCVCMDMRVYGMSVWEHTKQMLHCFRVF